jgi:cobalt-zinc-cadmium efflux system protein
MKEKQAEHHHHHHHDIRGHHHHDTKNIEVAFFLNLFFTIIEFIGGALTNSMAIMSDALHDLGDSFSIGLAWFLQKYSKKGSTSTFSYGYKRFSLLGALINAIVLTGGSIFILINAIPRLMAPQPVNASGMIWLAVLGIIVNGAAVINLKKGFSINEEVLSLHLLEDVLGWVAVLIGAIIMYFFDLPIIDPILSILIAGFILFNVIRSLNKVTKVLLQGVPDSIDMDHLHKTLIAFDKIHDVHDLHVWSMDGQYTVLTVHLVLQQNMAGDQLSELKKTIRDALKKEGIDHATLEFELVGEECVFLEC